ncbi:uncharacterized protein E0L32_004835 [Thyridium curvatum]|uniref:polynucleotide adenylyltransferase n=1 Tax=Thyridium curvatum TaxID=1093900 RepID=A0A507AW51_9PEZI|nr:uncharacterized protein E0L32_004835 [Thyridium curvatum]TPX15005.1 hypothetical protein E0L32_004835 [Thyridium curvatum]
MAASESPASSAIAVTSHDTALCIIPPSHLWSSIDKLRALYDKAFEKWPPHVNLVYPFVRVESLERSAELLQSAVQSWKQHSADGRLRIQLDSAGVFPHKHDNTIYIHDSDEDRNASLQRLRRAVLHSLGQQDAKYQMHLTVGQSDDLEGDAHHFLLDKVDSLPSIEWEASEIAILVRERMQFDGAAKSQMKLWGSISLSDGSLSRAQRPVGFYELSLKAEDSDEETAERDSLQSTGPYCYNDNTGLWEVYQHEVDDTTSTPERLVVGSYNVLAEFTWPVSRVRYPLLIKNILADNATADVLVLQEVTDDFLSCLLDNEDIRDAYPFVSHGPPAQSDIEPLPSLLNIVVLSKWPFDWEWVSFKRKHKGSVVVRFADIGFQNDDEFVPVILAAVHLTHGLTDGAISNKKIELQRILNYLRKTYPENPWILAGDFNLSSSSFTIEAALKKKAISALTSSYLAGFDDKFQEFGFIDAWSTARLEFGDSSDTDEVFEGEQGATFDPTVNVLATKIVGSGFNNRPQRFDRILIRGQSLLKVSRFNKFGFLMDKPSTDDTEEDELEPSFASDHWGVRCTLRVGRDPSEKLPDETDSLVVPVTLTPAPESLASASELSDTLSTLDVFPSEEEVYRRKNVLILLKSIILESAAVESSDGSAPQKRLKQSLILVPCGSYGLGVWTSDSDIDCLCIGPYSSQTFFALAVQRLRKAADRGVRILRRVRANTGTMLELEVQGVKIDLQYCPATAIAENWPTVLKLPPSHPVFTLSTQTLSKLKAVRDMDYIRRSVPDLAKFRTAHRLIKAWARSRGIYSAKFGYLGGIQVSILLARVCKMLARESKGPVSVPDMLTTFFSHYARFDWRHKMAFDPLYHRQRLPYTRTAREPLAILGYFPPSLNTSHAASIPSVRTIAEEFGRASNLLSEEGMTWSRFLCGDTNASTTPPSPALLDSAGAVNFTRAYKSYVKIDVQYWGISPSRGASFVGWLESRCVMVLVDLQRRLPGVHARIWPARFVSAEDAKLITAAASSGGDDDDDSAAAAPSAEASRDYQGCYLIGLEPASSHEDNATTTTTAREDAKVAAGTLQTVLHRFEEQIRGDDKYFDARCQWMSAEVVKRGDLGELCVDNRQWGGEYSPGDEEEEDDDDDDDDQEEGAEAEEAFEARGGDSEARGGTKKVKKGGKKATPPANAVVSRAGGSGKLRSALDVLSRLRWDPNLDSSDYIVGYEDRFTGAREKPLEQWKSEQTDEEFIPQHRVLYFKRQSDGVIVWERRTRKDELFGSGN